MKKTKAPADKLPLTIHLTLDQMLRVERVSRMLGIEPAQLATAHLFSGLDGWNTWGEFIDAIHDEVDWYCDQGLVTVNADWREMMERTAPDRIRRLGGLKISA